MPCRQRCQPGAEQTGLWAGAPWLVGPLFLAGVIQRGAESPSLESLMEVMNDESLGGEGADTLLGISATARWENTERHGAWVGASADLPWAARGQRRRRAPHDRDSSDRSLCAPQTLLLSLSLGRLSDKSQSVRRRMGRK